MQDISQLKQRASDFIAKVDEIELENQAAIKSRQSLENTILKLIEDNKCNKEALDIATHAIEILRQVSDEAVGEAYRFLEQSLNSSLAKMFAETTRRIELKESIRNNQYPQLKIILHVGNGKTRSLKDNSGHGLAQIVSWLSILTLIVITGSRRIVVMDEIVSGLDVHNRQVVNDIMWTFTEIGFQFIVSEHGFVPEGSRVYHLEMVGDVSHVKQTYIAKKGVYLQSDGKKPYDYSEVDEMLLESGGIPENELKAVDTLENLSDATENEVVSI